MSIYKSDVPELVRVALDSLLEQTLLPSEIVIVGDGPVPPQLEAEVERVKLRVKSEKLPIEVAYLPQAENGGLGEVMRIAMQKTKHHYIARMDADDICLPNRFEKQMKCFEEHPEVSVVGGQIAEFDGEVTNITGRRLVPLKHDEIARYMKSRNGMNHVTTILKKDDLLAAGNYQPLLWFEDYYLWVRMIQLGYKFRNIPDDMVLVRAGKAQIDRRGGWKYFLREHELFHYMQSTHFISWGRYMVNILERGCVRLLMPLSVRTWFYKHFLR